jgi:hypothetical protein
MNTDTFVNFAVRAVVGFGLGMLFGLFGFFLVWFVWPQNRTTVEIIPYMVTGTGLGAAAAGLFAWFRRDASRGYLLGIAVVAIVGGIGGAWAGYQYGKWAYDDFIVFRGPTRGAVIVAASLSTNALVSAYQIIVDWRMGQR